MISLGIRILDQREMSGNRDRSSRQLDEANTNIQRTRHRSDISHVLWSDDRPGPQLSEHAHPAGEDETALAAERRAARPAADDPAPTAGGAGRAEAQLGQTEAGTFWAA